MSRCHAVATKGYFGKETPVLSDRKTPVSYRARVIQLVHLVEVGHFGNVHKVDGAEIFDFFGAPEQGLVHLHAVGVPVVAKPKQDNLVFLAENGLVDLPAVLKMGHQVGHSD